MALTDASRAFKPPTAQAIGWDGRTLLQMLTEQERLFEETGRYYGLETLDLQRGDPIRYQKIFSRLRGGLVSARETAMNISASPIVKEIGELAFMLYTPQCDSISPARKIGADDKLFADHVQAGLRGTRTPMYWTLDERTRVAGCHMAREAVERVIPEEGIDSYKQFMREVLEEGRRSFRNRLMEMTVPGRFRAVAFNEVTFGAEQQLPSYARVDTMMHAPTELVITREGMLEFDYDSSSSWGYHSMNCTPSAMQGAIWVQLTQTQIPNEKINDGAYMGLRTNFPPGTWTNHCNPAASTGISWWFLIPSFTGFIKSLSRAIQARGFVEEVLAPYPFTANVFQGGGIDHFGQPSATTNLGLSCCGRGPTMVLDGLALARARWNPEGDMGDLEMGEIIQPFPYLGPRVKPAA